MVLAACSGGGPSPPRAAEPSRQPVRPGPVSSSLALPTLPRSAITSGELAVVIAQGDPLSEAIALAYQRARAIPEAHMLRLAVPAGQDVISAADFARLKASIDARLPEAVQATLLTFHQPSRVVGETCAMGITSALAFGYDPRWCGQCSRTAASPYFDSDSSRPWTDLRLRPSMMLGATNLAAAQALIARGLAADGSAPRGTGYLLRTSDAARSVRWADYPALPAAWSQAVGLALRYIDASAGASVEAKAQPGVAQQLAGEQDVLFYFTGQARVSQLDTLRFLPGAAADHLTSTGGVLPGGNGQMPITDWLAAGATASHGTVEEPCNHRQKFSQASVLIEHYLRGATLIEAYWKSVAWPGQSLFVGEPLARPWPDQASLTQQGRQIIIRTRSLRRGAEYRLDFRADASAAWRTLAKRVAGQPGPMTWRVDLPAEPMGQLRWVGPCALQPTLSCTLAGPP